MIVCVFDCLLCLCVYFFCLLCLFALFVFVCFFACMCICACVCVSSDTPYYFLYFDNLQSLTHFREYNCEIAMLEEDGNHYLRKERQYNNTST